jgi:type II secretion system protein J
MKKTLHNASIAVIGSVRAAIRAQSGFSLLEIMVATAVSSLILLMVYSAHRSIMSAIHDLTGVADFYESINLTVYRIDKDISCAYYRRENKDLCLIGESNRGTVSRGRLNFVTIDHEDLLISVDTKKEVHKSDVHEVGYYLQEDPDSPGLFNLIRREEYHYDDQPESGGKESIMLENVTDIRFEFRQRNTWTDTWDSRKYRKFPSAIRVTLKVKNFRGNEEVFIFTSYINNTQ